MKTVEQLAQSTNPDLVRAFGAIRRFVVTLTDAVLWQIAGVMMPDGREVLRAEVFGGVGLYARPSSSGTPEAMVAMANGGATNPMIIAVRDEKTRQAIIKALGGEPAPDTTMLHNSAALVKINPDETIEARSATGTAVELAKKSDVDALKAWTESQFSATAGHVHVTPTGPTTTIASVAAFEMSGPTSPTHEAPDAVGTQKFKGE